MSWKSELFLSHPRLGWTVDATTMALSPDQIDALDWAGAFAELRATESGDAVNVDERRQVGHYWLRDPHTAPTMGQARAIGETVEAVRAFANAVRSGEITAEGGERFTDVLHIGIGGSALGPQLLIDALPGSDDGLTIHFLDNTDPRGLQRAIERVDLRTTLAVVVTKSGSTPETVNAMLYAQKAFADAGLEVGSRMVGITVAGSKLQQRAEDEGWLRTFEIWDWVGGRFSVTSAVGLVPAELAGIDTAAFLEGAREMDGWTRQGEWRTNPAAVLAGCWHIAGDGKGDRAMVVLPYADQLLLLSRYLQQLVMESLGKKLDRQGNVAHAGIVVYGNKGSTDQHAYVQQLRDGRNDFFATFIQVLGGEPAGGTVPGDYLQGFLLGTRRALHEADRPSLVVTVPHVDAGVLGGLIALFERAVGLYATLIDINAYHQPGVEAGKAAAKQVLALSSSVQEALGERRTVDELAQTLGADATEIYYVLERLVATGRARRDGDGYRA